MQAQWQRICNVMMSLYSFWILEASNCNKNIRGCLTLKQRNFSYLYSKCARPLKLSFEFCACNDGIKAKRKMSAMFKWFCENKTFKVCSWAARSTTCGILPFASCQGRWQCGSLLQFRHGHTSIFRFGQYADMCPNVRQKDGECSHRHCTCFSTRRSL